MALWQQERLGGTSPVVDTADVETGVETVATPAGEDKPVGIARPVVVRVGVAAVGSGEWLRFPSVQIEQPVVGFPMPDREAAIIGHCEHDVSPVV